LENKTSELFLESAVIFFKIVVTPKLYWQVTPKSYSCHTPKW